MYKQIDVVIANNYKKNAIEGIYKNGSLEVSFSKFPKFISILIDEPVDVNDCEGCLGLLLKKIFDCEGLTINRYMMRYHNHAQNNCVFGGLSSMYASNKYIIEINYQITYSIYFLNL